jgi:hypothetical protein
MMKHTLLGALMLGSLLGLASGCSPSTGSVVQKPKEVPPMPDPKALKGTGLGGGNAGTPTTPVPAPEGIKPDAARK